MIPQKQTEEDLKKRNQELEYSLYLANLSDERTFRITLIQEIQMIRKALAELKESIENLSLESEQPIKEEKKELPRLPKPKYQDEEDEESENEEDDSDEEETDSEDEDEYVPPKKYPKLPQKK